MRSRTQTELEELLGEQIDYLKSSAERYDAGHRHEAKRLAGTIRTLLHNTSRSHSLLEQMDLQSRLLYLDTAGPVNRKNLLPLTPLLTFQLKMTETGAVGSYLPVFYDGPRPSSGLRAVPFELWWEMMVLRDSTHREYSRRDLVLFLANKVGGAHVDPKVQVQLDALSRSETVGFSVGDSQGERPMEEDPILPYVRQIAFELLEVLRVRQWLPGREPA